MIQGNNLKLSYGGAPLLDGVSFSIHRGERVCLLGRNGTGKSTLLKVIAGEVIPEEGKIIKESGTMIATLSQVVPEGQQDKSVFAVIAEGLEHLDDWQSRPKIDALISKMGLPEEAAFSSLSGGLRRRVLLAKALVQEPDLLILDEPTNHLDIEAIQWLESILIAYRKAILFVSHDREFVRKMATRIFDLDRGQLSVYNDGYTRYLEQKADALASEEKAWERFDKKLAQEEVWIRQGVKARRTRNEGRVLALEKMRRERQERREKIGKVQLTIDEGAGSGKLVIETKDLCYHYEQGLPIVQDLSLTFVRGDKIGIIGANGCGKSTLIQLLLKQLAPTSGTVRHGTGVQVAYFDQLRAGLDPEATVVNSITEGGSDKVIINGQPKHVYSYLQDFLFAPARARARVRTLSGGEINRLLLAKLFTKPANLLVLDEPTNDLDMETLELLEELLVDYQGTLLLVSHDRTFLNNVVTSTLVAEGAGRWCEYVGGYEDYLRQRPVVATPEVKKIEKNTNKGALEKSNKPKLSYAESRELAGLPDQLSSLEAKIQALQQQISAPEFYLQSSDKIAAVMQQLQNDEKKLAQLFERWERLESKAQG